MGSLSLAIGTVLMAFAFYIPEFDGYLVGNIFLALGGTFIFVPSFAIANAFPKYSGASKFFSLHGVEAFTFCAITIAQHSYCSLADLALIRRYDCCHRDGRL